MAKTIAKTSRKSKTIITVQKKDSPNTIKHPLIHEATIGNRRRWAAWQDWVSAGLGIYLFLAPMWTPSVPPALFMTLGILVFATAVWAGSTASSTLAEFVKMLLGAAVILSGLFGAHIEERTAILSSWIIGATLILLSLIASHRNQTGGSATYPYPSQGTHQPYNGPAR